MLLGPIQRGETVRDQQPVPASTVLLVERDDLAAGPGAGAKAGRLDLHQRHQGMRLGLAGCQRGEHAAEAHRLLAQLGACPLLAGGGGVALVEDQVDGLEHGAQPVGEFLADRDLEGHVGLGERLLRPGDPRRHRGRLHQERAGDLLGRQPGDHLQGEGHAGVDRQHRVARGEHQPQHVVLDVGVELDLVHRSLVITELATEQLDLALQCHGATDRVDAAAARHGHEPGARVVRDA